MRSSGSSRSAGSAFFPKVDPDDAYYRYFHSKGGANELSGGYANPAADKLLEEGESTVDAAKRAEVYRRRVELIADEVPVVIPDLGGELRAAQSSVSSPTPRAAARLAGPVTRPLRGLLTAVVVMAGATGCLSKGPRTSWPRRAPRPPSSRYRVPKRRPLGRRSRDVLSPSPSHVAPANPGRLTLGVRHSRPPSLSPVDTPPTRAAGHRPRTCAI